MLRPPLLALLALAAPSLAPAQPARVVEVELSSFDFDPDTIRLRAGEPVTLRLINRGDGGHNFVARDFFAAASGVSGPVVDGAVELDGGETADVRLVPVRGRYRLRCTHAFHSTLGMRGRIVVE